MVHGLGFDVWEGFMALWGKSVGVGGSFERVSEVASRLSITFVEQSGPDCMSPCDIVAGKYCLPLASSNHSDEWPSMNDYLAISLRAYLGLVHGVC